MTLPARPFLRFDPTTTLPITDRETLEFLEDTYDIQDTINLWDRTSGYPGLLNATPRRDVVQQAKKNLYEVVFDDRVGRYRYIKTGRFVKVDQVQLGVLRMSKSQQELLGEITQSLIDGEITQRQWYLQMRKEIKDTYRAAYIASIGGIENYNRSEISRFGHFVRPQYRWLDNFLLEIQSGKQPLNGFARNRARMYARAANGIYQESLFGVAERSGKKSAKRNLGPTEDHCHNSENRPGCVELAALGYVPLTQAVPIGDASCYSNCLCTWSFR